MWVDGEVVESFFDEETDYPVGVEDEVCAVGLDIADLAVEEGVRYCRRWPNTLEMVERQREGELRRPKF